MDFSILDGQPSYLSNFSFGLSTTNDDAQNEQDNALFEELTHSFIDYEGASPAIDTTLDEPDEYEVENDSEDQDEEVDFPPEVEEEQVELPQRPRPRIVQDPNRPIKKRKRDPIVAAHSEIIAEPFACGIFECEFASSGVASMTRHLRGIHPNELNSKQFKPFKCAMCGKRYRNSNGMKYHLLNGQERGNVGEQVFPGKSARGRPRKAAIAQKSDEDSPDEFLPTEDEDELGPTSEAAEISTPPPLPEIKTTKKSQKKEVQTEPLICPLSICGKEYRQVAGLRYHLLNGHDPPLSFEDVRDLNPLLAGRLAGRGKGFDQAKRDMAKQKAKRVRLAPVQSPQESSSGKDDAEVLQDFVYAAQSSQ